MGPTYLVLLVAGSACVVRYRGTDEAEADVAYRTAIAEHINEVHPDCSVIRSTIEAETQLAPPIERYTTVSGSVYEVCGNKIRRAERGPRSSSERFMRDWRVAEKIVVGGIGHPISVTWGTGADEHSPPGTPDDARNTRMTVTTPVITMGPPS